MRAPRARPSRRSSGSAKQRLVFLRLVATAGQSAHAVRQALVEMPLVDPAGQSGWPLSRQHAIPSCRRSGVAATAEDLAMSSDPRSSPPPTSIMSRPLHRVGHHSGSRTPNVAPDKLPERCSPRSQDRLLSTATVRPVSVIALVACYASATPLPSSFSIARPEVPLAITSHYDVVYFATNSKSPWRAHDRGRSRRSCT